MKIKSFAYQRVLNLGNFESKRLAAIIEVETNYLDTAEEECSELMELVERKIREDESVRIQSEIHEAEQKLREIRKEHQKLVEEIKEIVNPTVEYLPVEHYLNDHELGEGGNF
jgi:hypothetical protein